MAGGWRRRFSLSREAETTWRADAPTAGTRPTKTARLRPSCDELQAKDSHSHDEAYIAR